MFKVGHMLFANYVNKIRIQMTTLILPRNIYILIVYVIQAPLHLSGRVALDCFNIIGDATLHN